MREIFNKILYEIFTCMNIATCVLQGMSTYLLSAMEILKECINDITLFRNTYSEEKLKENLEKLSKMDYGTNNSEKDNQQGYHDDWEIQ